MGTVPTSVLCIVVILSVSFFGGAECVRIKGLTVPKVIQNGTQSSVVLDCEYTYEEYETKGLVVKWFFNNMPAPVYQWIPKTKPSALGVLRDRVNLEYRATNDEMTMYRALQITQPTTDLTGEYKCKVSTFEDEDFMAKKMVVFAPEKSLELTQNKVKENYVNITCSARGAYPEPKMVLTKNPTNKAKVGIDGVILETRWEDGSYNITASKLIEDKELQTPTLFECELKIPDAEYTVRRSIMYDPGPTKIYSTTTSAPIVEIATTNPTADNGGATIVAFSSICLIPTIISVYWRL